MSQMRSEAQRCPRTEVSIDVCSHNGFLRGLTKAVQALCCPHLRTGLTLLVNWEPYPATAGAAPKAAHEGKECHNAWLGAARADTADAACRCDNVACKPTPDEPTSQHAAELAEFESGPLMTHLN